MLYALVGLPTAALSFVFVVLSTLAGLALIVTLLGLPLIALGGIGAIAIGRLYIALAAKILGQPIAVERSQHAPPGFLGWLQARLLYSRAWRARLYLLLKLPVAAGTLYVTALLSTNAVLALLYPIIGTALEPAHRLPLGLGAILIATWPLTVVVGLAGALTLLAIPWAIRGMVHFDLVLMRGLLGPTAGSLRIERLEAARSVVAEGSAATMRRIERDLHDGTQAQLVALAMNLGDLKERMESEPGIEQRSAELDLVTTAHHHAKEALTELRGIVRGIHPPALDLGLANALATVTARSAVPAVLSAELATRPSDAIETIVYYAVAELLANAAKHSGARHVAVDVAERGRQLLVTVTDDGRGGANSASGTGLQGLAARLDAVDGSLTIDSPSSGPTVITLKLPFRI
ncbi:MAG TPA: sensor domain-containing protein [Candidatus Dormibacteraeota bacterium]